MQELSSWGTHLDLGTAAPDCGGHLAPCYRTQAEADTCLTQEPVLFYFIFAVGSSFANPCVGRSFEEEDCGSGTGPGGVP